MLNQNFVYLGLLFSVISGYIYLADVLKGKVKPNKVTYFLWALAPFVAFFAEIKQGVGIQSLFTFITGFIPLSIFVASFVNKKSYWKLNRFDFICGALSLFGLLLWYATKVGNIAIAFGILADGLAYIPTIIKSYYHPETENGYSYLLSAVSAGITLLTVKIWNFETYSFPVYLLIIDVIVFILIEFRISNWINGKEHA